MTLFEPQSYVAEMIAKHGGDTKIMIVDRDTYRYEDLDLDFDVIQLDDKMRLSWPSDDSSRCLTDFTLNR